jgi:hypothetical protein
MNLKALTGKWRSTVDRKWIIEFKDNLCIDTYDDKDPDTIQVVLSKSCSVADAVNEIQVDSAYLLYYKTDSSFNQCNVMEGVDKDNLSYMIQFNGKFVSFEKVRVSNKNAGISQIPQGSFLGLEDMGSSDPSKPKYKWYHLNHLTIHGDSAWLDQNPISIHKKDTAWSASDVGFYNYRGTARVNGYQIELNLELKDCDYCAMPGDSARRETFRRKQLSGQITGKGFELGGHVYKQAEAP